jgi:Sulfotransferase family
VLRDNPYRDLVDGPVEHGQDGTETVGDALRPVTVEVCPDPVFIIGSPRSGTSVLAWSLAQHRDLWTSNETEFISVLFDQAAAVYRKFCSKPDTFITKHGIDHKEFHAALGLGINALISSRSEGKRWIDNSPGYTTAAWALKDMFPGSSFIHIVRDGRSVVNSMQHFRDRAPSEPWTTDFTAAVEMWNSYVKLAMDFCERNPEDSLTVRNEDLIEGADEEFERILAFLGVAHESAPAKFFRTSRINSSFGPLVWGAEAGTVAESTVNDVHRGTAARAWREWSDGQREIFTEIGGDLLRRLDYPDEVG